MFGKKREEYSILWNSYPQARSSEKHINYGWEPAAFYQNWMSSSAEDNPMPEMHGASIDITSPNLVSMDGVLALFKALLDDMWIAKFKRHYGEVKVAVSKNPK